MKAPSEKQQAHELIDRLEPTQVSAVIRILRHFIMDPVSRAVSNAPAEDESIPDDERQALARSEAWFHQRGGTGTAIEEVLAEFGLTPDDFPIESQPSGPQD